jgi:two-component system, cell cycle sensor histidine kinase and response regulator CckA
MADDPRGTPKPSPAAMRVVAGLDEFCAQVFDQLFGGVQIVDHDLRYVYVNPVTAQQAQRSAAELIGRRVSDEFPDFATTDAYRAIERCLEEREPINMINEFRRDDGSASWFELRMTPIPLGVLIQSIDITDRLRMEARVHNAERLEAIGRLAGGVAHDFNNLVTVILGHAQLADDLRPTEAVREHLAGVRHAGERAAALTAQLLTFARRQPVAPQVLPFNEALDHGLRMVDRLVGAAVDVEIALDPAAGNVRLDPTRVEQVLLNLAANARDAMPRGGRLSIATGNVVLDVAGGDFADVAPPGRYVRLVVEDTGEGMDEETQARAFEPFFTTKDRGLGHGLGLATCHGIVTQAGGHIRVHSVVGRGTRFELFFPRHEEAPEVANPS